MYVGTDHNKYSKKACVCKLWINSVSILPEVKLGNNLVLQCVVICNVLYAIFYVNWSLLIGIKNMMQLSVKL